MATSPIAGRAKRGTPCHVCESATKGCSWTEDGLHLCRGEPADTAAWADVLRGKADDAGYRHYRRREDDRGRRDPQRNGHAAPTPVIRPAAQAPDAPPPAPAKPKPTPHPIPGAKPGKPQTWREQAQAFARAASSSAIAANLQLPLAAIDGKSPVLGLGYTTYGMKAGDGTWIGAVTFPMFDGGREPCGITKRLDEHIADTHKYTMPGGKLGVILGRDWSTRPGPLLIPEGGSDTVALATCGLAAVGRPSNAAGAEVLAELLADCPADRRIVVLGENDRKATGKWPGKEGVDTVAPRLAAALNRPIYAAYPPEGVKDWRDWVRSLIAEQGDALDLMAIGEVIRQHVEATAVAIQPGEKPADAATELQAPRFEFLDSIAFAQGDFRPQWHVKRILVKGQPAVIAGPSKSLKTSLAIDLAVSLASGTPFLGEFAANRCRVAVVSGESGAHTLQETAHRVCAAKGIRLADLSDSLQWCFDLPTFSDPAGMVEFTAKITALRADVVILDPLYLTLGAIDPRNMFGMGAALRAVAGSLLKAGATPLILHHANGQLQTGRPMELANLAYTGLEQFARQWLLLNRRSAYSGDGKHELWLSAGGSAGHGGIWSLAVDEGIVEEDFSGRVWSTAIQNLSEAKEEAATEKQTAKTEKVRKQLAAERAAVLLAIDAEVSTGRGGATLTRLRERTGSSANKLKEIITGLIQDGDIEFVNFEAATGNKATNKMDGWRRTTEG